MEKPVGCKKIVFQTREDDWASVHFSSKKQIRDLVALLEKMMAGEIDHVHLQHNEKENHISEIAFHYPPALKRQWPHYFD